MEGHISCPQATACFMSYKCQLKGHHIMPPDGPSWAGWHKFHIHVFFKSTLF